MFLVVLKPISNFLLFNTTIYCSAALQPKKELQSAVRKWLAVNADGEAIHLELAKLRVTHYLGVQLRDLRWEALQRRQAALSSQPTFINRGA